MRRLLTSVVALSLLVAGFLPLAAPMTPNVCDHATIVTTGRFHGTIAVTTTKRSPVAPAITLFATVAPARQTTLSWTHELVVLSRSIFAPQLDHSPTCPRAPPTQITAS